MLHKVIQLLIKRNSSQKGFTLIELLVVIGILGILASALVATIDPFEQLKKAQDANVKNALVEYLNATTRYYTTHNAYPWDTTTNGGNGCGGGTGTAPNGTQNVVDYDANNPADTCTSVLAGENEIKKAFSSDTNDLSKIYLYYDSTNNAVVGCYQPQSQSQQKNKETSYTNSSGTTTDTTNSCKANGGNNYCYWCTK